MNPSIFAGRDLVIATMHGKETVMAPVLERELGVRIILPAGFDTDRFGTFSGEVLRPKDPLETARMKCSAAAEHTGCSLIVASEGSFGPHPGVFFIPSDDELVVLIDFERGREYKARELTTKTNFRGTLLHTWEEVQDFAAQALFPSHALIVRKAAGANDEMVKGICDWSQLALAAKNLLSRYGQVFVETDMRAMYNPTRMAAIASATERLTITMNQLCPMCAAPGYEVKEAKPGLPCELCKAPTRSTLSYLWGCMECGYEEEEYFPHHKTVESAMYCDRCNP
ncbi:MAG: hypothetical protein KF744_08500 [Taibaiella sp.]|nr:hypothetical protein [Taibaiella sp.]